VADTSDPSSPLVAAPAWAVHAVMAALYSACGQLSSAESRVVDVVGEVTDGRVDWDRAGRA
jgi:hypothetical protein